MGGPAANAAPAGASRQLAPSSILAPPTPFSSFGLAGTESAYQGGFLSLAPLLITQHSGGQDPPPHGSGPQTLRNSPLHPQTDQEVAFAGSSHLPCTSPSPYPPPLHSGGAGESAGWASGSGTHSPPPWPARAPLPTRPARTPLTWKPAQLPPTSLLRIANRTAGVGPPAGHSSASAALAGSRGPNVRRGRTGGWLFLGGGLV